MDLAQKKKKSSEIILLMQMLNTENSYDGRIWSLREQCIMSKASVEGLVSQVSLWTFINILHSLASGNRTILMTFHMASQQQQVK